MANEKPSNSKPGSNGKPEPRVRKFAGYQVVISGLGPFRAGTIVTEEQLTGLGVTAERIEQLLNSGDLAEVWE